MAEIRPYKENFFARRKKIYSILALALLAAAATGLAAWYLHSRGGGADPYAGKVVRISGSTQDVGLVKSFRAGRSISYFSARSGFHDLIHHRFLGEYDIQVLASDVSVYLDTKKRQAAAGRRAGGLPAQATPSMPPAVEIVSGDEENIEGAPDQDDSRAVGEMPEAVPGAAAADDVDDTPGYARPRELGVRAYDDEVGALAVKADRIDELWQKHQEFCQGTIAVSVGNVYGRKWFGIYTTINAADTPECKMMIQEMQTLAAEIDAGMDAAWEKAHRAGVYPGQVRAVQQKYRMELDRWNR